MSVVADGWKEMYVIYAQPGYEYRAGDVVLLCSLGNYRDQQLTEVVLVERFARSTRLTFSERRSATVAGGWQDDPSRQGGPWRLRAEYIPNDEAKDPQCPATA